MSTLRYEDLIALNERVNAEITQQVRVPKRVFVTLDATEDTDERMFPESRHRSKRLLKKLLKRFGHEYRQRPAVFETDEAIMVHPALANEYQRLHGYGF